MSRFIIPYFKPFFDFFVGKLQQKTLVFKCFLPIMKFYHFFIMKSELLQSSHSPESYEPKGIETLDNVAQQERKPIPDEDFLRILQESRDWIILSC